MGRLIGRRTVRDFIERHAAAGPDRAAILDPETGATITWADLAARARAVDAALGALGIGPGEVVSVMMPNGPWLATLILGILHGGRIVAPINLAAGDPQIAYMIEHSETRAIIVGPGEEERLAGILATLDAPPPVIRLDPAAGPDWPAEAHRALAAGAEPAPAPATNTLDGLLMYTSGTTGRPKGAVLTQRAILTGGENAILAHRITAGDRSHLVLPLYHINGFCVTLMSTLVAGASLVAPPRFSVSRFWREVIDHRCTWFSAVPTQYQYLLRAAEAEGPPPREAIAHVRFARSASAPLSPEVHRVFEQIFGLVLIETMGLTECAAQITSNPLPPGERRIGSPGCAVGNEVTILGPDHRPVPPDAEGEIAVRGDNVFRLYLKNPEATREAFTADGWFLTGDLGRMDADGYLWVTGRRKELIIKGGENIAPREIDEALLQHPEVVEAAAFAVPCPDYGQRVEAAVRLTEGARVGEAELIALCRAAVGPFKAPDRVHILPDLPKGPSGKVQRLKLAGLLGA